MLFQLSNVRRRLLFLVKDSYIQTYKIIKPSTIPTEFKTASTITKQQNKQTRRISGHVPKSAISRKVLQQQQQQQHSSRGVSSNITINHRNYAFIDESNISTINSLALEDNENDRKSSNNGRSLGRPSRQLRASSRRNTSGANRNSNNTRTFSINSSSTASTWYMLPSNIVLKRPSFCSMEMISFDKENECFHRTEIAYPYVVQEPLATQSKSVTNKTNILSSVLSLSSSRDENDENKNRRTTTTTTSDTTTVNRRLAKKLEIRTSAVNNIYKHSLIWQ
jgi:hypothetical protein